MWIISLPYVVADNSINIRCKLLMYSFSFTLFMENWVDETEYRLGYGTDGPGLKNPVLATDTNLL